MNNSTILHERAAQYGTETLSDTELLFLLAGDVGPALVEAAGSLDALRRWKIPQIARVRGVGPATAARIAAALALGLRRDPQSPPMLNTPELLYRHLQTDAAQLSVERFWVLCLTRKNRLIRAVVVTSGTATSCLVHPREVFHAAITNAAPSIVVAHNHPSGDPSPSSADIQITRQLKEASRTVGIDLLDHIIIGDPREDPRGQGFYSFHEAGLIA